MSNMGPPQKRPLPGDVVEVWHMPTGTWRRTLVAGTKQRPLADGIVLLLGSEGTTWRQARRRQGNATDAIDALAGHAGEGSGTGECGCDANTPAWRHSVECNERTAAIREAQIESIKFCLREIDFEVSTIVDALAELEREARK